MKAFVIAWIATLVLGYVWMVLFVGIFGDVGTFLMIVTLIAAFIAAIATLGEEMEELRNRVKKLEVTLNGEEQPPEDAEAQETDAERLDKLYRNYSDKKLQKITEDPEYREDAKALARRILSERSEHTEEG